MKVTTYTYAYLPFAMGGGNKYVPIKSELEAESLNELGKGYKGYLIKSPDNEKVFIAEHQSGAIVGNSIESVKKDIEDADDEVMKNQIKEAKEEWKNAKVVSEEKWWQLLGFKSNKGK